MERVREEDDYDSRFDNDDERDVKECGQEEKERQVCHFERHRNEYEMRGD